MRWLKLIIAIEAYAILALLVSSCGPQTKQVSMEGPVDVSAPSAVQPAEPVLTVEERREAQTYRIRLRFTDAR